VAGRLLRYDLTATLRSSLNPNNMQQSVMKGIIEEKEVKWSDYAPIIVTSLPFYIKAEIGAPVILLPSSSPTVDCGTGSSLQLTADQNGRSCLGVEECSILETFLI
jgi:hypothetical protein